MTLEVQYFCACLGIGSAVLQSRLEKHGFDGEALLSIAKSMDVVRDLFPEDCPKSGGSIAAQGRYRLLVANVDFFLRALQKAKEPPPFEDDLRSNFPSLEIPKEDLKLTGFIGEGGFSRVYSGICRDVRVAAKAVEGVHEKTGSNEMRILEKLQGHPNFPVLLGYSLPHNIIVMELVPGQSLHDLLHSRKRRTFLSIYRECDFGYRDILHVSEEVCTGMAYMHSQNIVHCDIKTMNILVSNHQPAPDATMSCCLVSLHTNNMPVEFTRKP